MHRARNHIDSGGNGDALGVFPSTVEEYAGEIAGRAAVDGEHALERFGNWVIFDYHDAFRGLSFRSDGLWREESAVSSPWEKADSSLPLRNDNSLSDHEPCGFQLPNYQLTQLPNS